MKKVFAIILSVSYFTACSFFAGTKQTVTVMTNVPTAEIYANGEKVGTGTSAKFKVKRNKTLQLMAKADGYSPAFKDVDTKLSMTGILDFVGFFFILVPIFGLFTPGAKSLDQDNMALELVPLQANIPQTSTANQEPGE